MRRITGRIDIASPIEEAFDFVARRDERASLQRRTWSAASRLRCSRSFRRAVIVGYGVGVSLNDMRDLNKARTRLPVQAIGPLSTSEAVDA